MFALNTGSQDRDFNNDRNHKRSKGWWWWHTVEPEG